MRFRLGLLISAVTGFLPGACVHLQGQSVPVWRAASDETNATFSTFDVGDAGLTYPSGINAEGTIVGWYRDHNLVTHGFVRESGGSVTTIDIPNAQVTYPRGINDFGEVFGVYYYSSYGDEPAHPFVAFKGLFSKHYSIEELEVPNAGGGAELTAINIFGTVVGQYRLGMYDGAHGFLRDVFGRVTTFDPPGANKTFVSGVNDVGMISGTYEDANNQMRGFVRSLNGRFITFDGPGSTEVNVNGINGKGETIGQYFPFGAADRFQFPHSHGFVREPDGGFTTFDGSTSAFLYNTAPVAINWAGAIAGYINIVPYSYELEGFLSDNDFVRDRNGAVTAFDPPTAHGTSTAINWAGTVTGYFQPEGPIVSGFVRKQNH